MVKIVNSSLAKNSPSVSCSRCSGPLTADDTFRLLSACKSCRDKYKAHVRSAMVNCAHDYLFNVRRP